MPAPPQTPAPEIPPPPTPAPAEVIGQAEVAADDRDRERNNQGDRVGEIRGRDTDRGQAGNRQDRAVNDNKVTIRLQLIIVACQNKYQYLSVFVGQVCVRSLLHASRTLNEFADCFLN